MGRPRSHEVYKHYTACKRDGTVVSEEERIKLGSDVFFKCNYCEKTTKSNAGRQRSHLVNCKGDVPSEVREHNAEVIEQFSSYQTKTRTGGGTRRTSNYADLSEVFEDVNMEESSDVKSKFTAQQKFELLYKNSVSRLNYYNDFDEAGKAFVKEIMDDFSELFQESMQGANSEIEKWKKSCQTLRKSLAKRTRMRGDKILKRYKQGRRFFRQPISSDENPSEDEEEIQKILKKSRLEERNSNGGEPENPSTSQHGGEELNETQNSTGDSKRKKDSRKPLNNKARQIIYEFYRAQKHRDKLWIYQQFAGVYNMSLRKFREIIDMGNSGQQFSTVKGIKKKISPDDLESLLRLAKEDVSLSTSELGERFGISKDRAYRYLRLAGIRRPTAEYCRRMRMHAAGQTYTPYLSESVRERALRYQSEYHKKKRAQKKQSDPEGRETPVSGVDDDPDGDTSEAGLAAEKLLQEIGLGDVRKTGDTSQPAISGPPSTPSTRVTRAKKGSRRTDNAVPHTTIVVDMDRYVGQSMSSPMVSVERPVSDSGGDNRSLTVASNSYQVQHGFDSGPVHHHHNMHQSYYHN